MVVQCDVVDDFLSMSRATVSRYYGCLSSETVS